MDEHDDYVIVKEYFWREGDKWFTWSSLYPDEIHESPVVVIPAIHAPPECLEDDGA